MPALQTRFMSASTTRPFSTLMNLASWPPISTIERLRPPSGSSAAAAVAWATISFWTVSRPSELREGGAEDGRRGVAARAGEADGDHRGRMPSRRPRRPAPAPPRRGCPPCAGRRSPARRRWRRRPARPWSRWSRGRGRARPRAHPVRRRRPRAGGPRGAAPNRGPGAPDRGGRCGCAAAGRAPAGRRGSRRAARRAGRPRRGRPRRGRAPAARDAANRSAPSASKTPAWSATVTGASLRAAIPAATGAMRAPCPIRTTGPSILLLS